jgi:muramoyltetrapeptide carboxypeptidase LdcA involved in peptidoglycan recycling
MTNTPLQPGDEIRIVAPSSAWNAERAKQYERAKKKLETLGFNVNYGKYMEPATHLDAVDVKLRAKDINDAYRDNSVKAIMALNGGWLANSLLPYLDWDVIKANPKPFIGYSDITVLLNAIYAKTGNVGYLGPNLGTFGIKHEAEYTAENLCNVLCGNKSPISLAPSKKWGEGKKRKQYTSQPWEIIQPGNAEGRLVGGNIATLYLIQGTEYYPVFKEDTILALEDDDEAGEYTTREFDRRLESILQQPNARKYIKAIVIGRFQSASKVSMEDLRQIIRSKNLKNIPVVANVDFGHTQPLLTLPIGGRMSVSTTSKNKVILTLL